MIFAKKKSIEDIIIEILLQDPYQTGPQLINQVNTERGEVTQKQSVYTALGSLLKEEIVVKTGGQYFISKLWRQQIYNILKFETHERTSKI